MGAQSPSQRSSRRTIWRRRVPEDELGDALFALLAPCEELDVEAGTALETSLATYEDRLGETGAAGSGE